MDRYQRVQKPKEATSVNENEIRITAQGRMRSYITYATSLLQVSTSLPKHQVKPLSEFDYGGEGSPGGRGRGRGDHGRGRGLEEMILWLWITAMEEGTTGDADNGIGGWGRGRGNGFRGRGRGYGGWTDHQQDNRYNDEAPIFNHGRGCGCGWGQNRGRGRDSRSNGLVRTVNGGA
ncbi:heterogeneous nuclear ribonucleoprotein 87F-like [Phoenix dactylifera]|uniref:Heterogeneous nuclear ribonucleoprotein 87F-like n=1 Tax=Phoenix dactylifera TaxID=42345 RepID=A0A8B9A6L0_PHODC|nr:heterogeneous nuclear ribonucleoprotein 87F-like [Phoenix dactylifera]XP_038982286.1 heterogeneous nuclear ribonucleoprotein 87F-like [Phoenix dactylifera]